MRVHELAKKHGISNKDFLKVLHDMGVEVSSHLSGLTEEEIEFIEENLGETGQEEDKKKKKKKKVKVKESADDEEKPDKKEKKSRKKKARRHDFVVRSNEEFEEEKVIEEDGVKIIKVKDDTTVSEFAERLGVPATEIIKKLFLKGEMLTINSPISYALAEELAMTYDVLVEEEKEVEIAFGDKFDLEIPDRESDLAERAPVITIMGHVDHGKTSLLDALRKTSVAEGEAGGITQKIGAYQIVKNGKRITFIDTPGHEAFTDMRARGAKVTDIAILVVAADDGVMPQTIEAVSHAKEADVPIIVAVNKIDKPDANPMRVKQELMEHGVVSVEWGGDVEFVEISAKFGENLDELLETILITSEILELKANANKRAKGIVLESRLDPKVGPIADVLIQEGTLKVGDVIVAGESSGKVRALLNDRGERVDQIEVSQPTEIVGFNIVPEAGDILYVIQNEKHAKRIVEEMTKERKLREQNRKKHVSLEMLSQQLEEDKIKELKLIIRADSKGSVEALKESLYKLSTDEVAVNIIQATSGAISEGDVKLAEASDAIIIGFNVRPTTKAMKEADKTGVEIRTHNVIYHITEEIEKALTGMLEPEYREAYLGRIEIKKVFKITKLGNVAGCVVVDGKVNRDANIRVLRNGIVVYDGKLASLKRFQDDAKEVVAGQECGLGIQNFNDIKEGDIIEAYAIEEIQRTLK